MAFVDLFGEASGGAEGHLDITHRRFEPVEDELLPRGPAWDPEDPVRRRLVASQMTELSRVDVRADELARELDPHTTFSLIEDWLTELGLPECAPLETLEAKRAAVLAKLLAEGGHNQSWVWWQEALEALGYPPEFFLSGQDALDCNDDCLDDCKDEEWPFIWQILVYHGTDDELLQCFVNHNALLGTLALVHFLWEPVVVIADPADLYGVACTTKGFVAAVGAGGFVAYAADYDDPSGWNGNTQAGDLYAVAAVDDVLVACGQNPVNFLRSIDHGATWISVEHPTEEMYAITQGIGAGVALAGGELGIVWRSFDYGASWALATALPVATNIFGMTRFGDALTVFGVVAACQNGHLYRTPNSGTLWTDVGNAGTALYGVGAWLKVVVAVGAGGVIVRSDNGATSFAPVTSPTTANLRAVVGTPVGRWTAVGDDGVIIQSLDNGVTWKVQTSPTTDDLFAVTRHIPSDRAIIVGQNIRIIVE
jgi:uncharacterized protein YmfQ (DUF2313 family)/photosystem II stability/assembly factor-like uncharacterized protein